MSSFGKHYDVIVLGAGGAGLMCALTAGQRGRRVLVLEHNDAVGKKIGISGGGRCNFTNLGATAANYLSQSKDFCKSALARYKPADFIAMVERHKIAYHEKTLGQQFCNGSSRQIIEMLLKECAEGGVTIRCATRVFEVEKQDRFRVETDAGLFTSDSLVIATGGLSFAKLGASDFGYRLAKQFDHPITELRPGLVPLTFTDEDKSLHELSGVSLPITARHGKAVFDEDMLFTHRGLSGPVILQISSYWREGTPVELNVVPGRTDWITSQRHLGRTFAQILSERLPKRFVEAWAARFVPKKSLAQTKQDEFDTAMKSLNAWQFYPAGTEGYPKAEVTLGGVDTRELSSKTMESRKVAGLFFIGEVVDVTGWLGGYNFQWAWASGHAAGEAV